MHRLTLDWMRRVRPEVAFIYEYMADPFVVRDGRVFVAWAGSDSRVRILAALDEMTGARLWTLRSDVWREPVAATDTTLIARSGTSPVGMVALDAATGELRWSRPAAEPVVADSAVQQMIAVIRKPGERRVASIEADTGRVAWSRRIRVDRYPSILFADGRVIAPVSTDLGRRALVMRADDGSTVRSFPIRGTPSMIAGGRMFTQRFDPDTDGPPDLIVEAQRLADGALTWRARVPYLAQLAAVGSGSVFVNRSVCVESCEGDYGGTYLGGVLALDARTGRVEWRLTGDESRDRPVWNAAAITSDLVFVERLRYGRAEFGALDVRNGKLRWTTRLEPPGVSGAVHLIANGAVFGALRFGEEGGRVVRLALPDSAAGDRRLGSRAPAQVDR